MNSEKVRLRYKKELVWVVSPPSLYICNCRLALGIYTDTNTIFLFYLTTIKAKKKKLNVYVNFENYLKIQFDSICT